MTRPQAIEKLARIFTMLPGIGQRQASRFAYWLADADKSVAENLKTALSELSGVKKCSFCFRIHSGGNLCSTCMDEARDSSKIAVVEKDADFENMEKSGVYDGKYHVLGGLISALDIEKQSRLRLKEIFKRVQKDTSVKEIILALSSTPEGEFTARYVERIIEPLIQNRALKITRLGRGLSSGAEMEYLSRETLKNALENRK